MAAPLDADATRGRHLKAITGSGGFVVTVAAVAAAAFIAGAAARSLPVMAGAPPVVVLAALAIAYVIADKRAESEFFSAYALRRKLIHYDEGALMEFTPLLGAGDRRRCRHLMEGDYKGVHVRLALFTYEIRHQTRTTKGTTTENWEPHDFTICVVDMEEALRTFQGFFLRRRRGVLSKLEDDEWLSGRGFPRLQLESIAFNERYELFRDRAMSENLLRQLFSPSLVQWLAAHPLAPGVEFKAGMLVVFFEGHADEAGRLDWLLEAAVELHSRVAREAGEALHRA